MDVLLRIVREYGACIPPEDRQKFLADLSQNQLLELILLSIL